MKRLSVPLLALLLLTGCGIRLDTPDPTPSEPSAAEVTRQREALRAELLAETKFVPVAAHAADQLEALGGVWVAWPDGDGPTDAPAPQAADVSVPGDERALVELLAETTPDLVEAATQAGDDTVAALYASIALSRTSDEADARVRLGEGAEPEWPESVLTSVPTTIRALDEAAYILDTLAAQDAAAGAETTARADAVRFRAWATASVETLGIAGTDDDPREAVYTLAGIDRGRLYAELAETLLAAVPSAADRTSVIASAQASATQAAALGATLDALPGL